MNKQEIIKLLKGCANKITEDRLFYTERGYQGVLASLLSDKLKRYDIWPGKPLVEEEYQKCITKHKIQLRPDIIIHIPFERGVYEERNLGNLLVIMLKLNSSKKTALKDYDKLALICKKLDYLFAGFLNIGKPNSYFSSYQGSYRERMFGISIIKRNGVISIKHDA
jgi:hypothetical protein